MDVRGVEALFMMYCFIIIQDMIITYSMEK